MAKKSPQKRTFLFLDIFHIIGILRSPGVEPGFREPESHVRSITLTAQVPNYITQSGGNLQVFSVERELGRLETGV